MSTIWPYASSCSRYYGYACSSSRASRGRLNKVVQFIKVKDWKHNLIVPDSYSQYERLHSLSDVGICDILNIALDANREALSSDNRFNMTITVPTLNAFHLGEIMFMHCWAVYFESIFAGVDAFDQPGVEVYKRLIGPIGSSKGCT